jgi:hypothetical protein
VITTVIRIAEWMIEKMMTMIPSKTVVVENTAAITDKMHLSATENVDGKTGALADCVVFIE